MNTIVTSEDGSHTIKSQKYGVTYHSTYGALAESMTVFIEPGLNYALERKTRVKILEMGFGTGLNALLSLERAANQSFNIEYTGVEAYPISLPTVKQLNYVELIKDITLTDLNNIHGEDPLLSIHGLQLRPNFSFNKFIGKMEDVELNDQYDVIYYDAFAPRSQPELWGEGILGKMYNHTVQGGALTTYCAQGAFKRALRAVGYRVENLPGPKGKREMTRAIKDE